MAGKKGDGKQPEKKPSRKPAARGSEQREPGAARKPDPSTDSNKSKQKELFSIVGIGASAGGLAALKTFFTHVPENSGLAFVVVVHLSPKHESHLADLLQPHVKMPVQQVAETTSLERNRVYVIPPNANLNTIDTHLRLSELEERRQERAPIDHFFRTLATTHDGEAIGVILTGTGSDGTLGLKEVKERGGLTIVQDPNEAEYDGMPQSAISTGLVDLILPLAEIPQSILHFVRTRPRITVPEEGEEVDGKVRQLLQKVFAQLRARTGRDFSRYKRSTIMRRVARRMQFNRIEELPAYLELLRAQHEEVRALADDLLITVTNFFRDENVFQQLENEILPLIFEGKGPDDEVRIWSVGCATGEEAYSMAILLLEAAAGLETPPRIQIFASDLHERSLGRARDGFYPGDIETDVSPERLKRFFVKENGGYRIRKDVRELVVFAPHNLLGDPPFSRLDLVTCRNLLIYLQRDVQREVIGLFHYALRPDGFLVLGQSESLDSSDLFRVEDKKNCIYQKRNVQAPEPRLPVFPLTRSRLAGEPPHPDRGDEPLSFGLLHQRIVEQVAPPSLLVSPDDRVVHLSAHAGRYLVHPGGEITANVFKLVREELRLELRVALRAARESGRPVLTKPIPIRFNGESGHVVLDVRPALEPQQERFALIIFDEREPATPVAPVTKVVDPPSGEPDRVRELEADLDLMRQRLQAVIEEDETSREELKASNEELQSANEELRSTMEELETSKEELQSMNEELHTVNQENRHKVEELGQLSSDLQNLLAATEIATLFLDRKLCILRFTPKVSELFNVRSTDRGRPLLDFTHRLGYDELEQDARHVLERLIPLEREVRDQEGRWYLTRVLPYRSSDDRIEGIVITFVEITERARAQEALQLSEQRLKKLNESLEQQVAERVKQLSILQDVATASNEAERVEEAIELTLRRICDTQNWAIGHAYCLNDADSVMQSCGLVHSLAGSSVQGQADTIARLLKEHTFARGEGLVGKVFETGQPIAATELAQWWKQTQRLADLGLSAALAFPITINSQVVGILEFFGDRAMVKDEHLLEIMSSIGNELGHVVRRERLERALVEATEKQQQLLGQELHDSVSQLVVGSRLVAEELREGVAKDPPLGQRADKLAQYLKDLQEQVRQLSHTLRPVEVDALGLRVALQELAAVTESMHKISCTFHCDDSVTVENNETATHLYRIAQEAIRNAVTHGKPDRIEVVLTRDSARPILTVRDDGGGFLEGTQRGVGMRIMEHRARMIHARLEIHSESGGVTVRCEID